MTSRLMMRLLTLLISSGCLATPCRISDSRVIVSAQLQQPAHAHTAYSQKVKGQGHQAALLTAALTRQAAAAVTVRTY